MNRDPREIGYEKEEQWIDDALAEYAKAEPRAGFEARVLVRLQAAQEQPLGNSWWRGVFAIGAAAMFLLALLWLTYQNARQASETQITKAAPKSTEPVAKASRRIGPSKHDRKRLAKAGIKGTSPPKREQFPAALPLNDQERLLARYVQDFPDRAALVARAQTDLRKLNELEMGMPQPANDIKSSDRQE